MAASERRDHQLTRIRTVRPGKVIPQSFALERDAASDARFATPSTLRHTLRRLKRMEVIAVHAAVANADALAQRNAVGHIDRWHPACHRQ